MSKLLRLMKLLTCFALITSFMGSAGYAATQKQESTGQYVDDSVITTKVKAAIFNEATLKTLQINVKTYKAVVQLSGFVDTAKSSAKAEEVAKGVEGVASVENSLIVK